MFGYLDFVYTPDGKFGMIIAFNKQLHKFKVVFNWCKSNESSEYYYKEDLKAVI
jgi:hypothetical protein